MSAIRQVLQGVGGRARRRCRAVEGFDLDPDMAGMATNPERVAVRDDVIEVVERVFAEWTVEDLLVRLDEVGIPAGKVRSLDEVYSWDQTASQGLLVDVEHASLGRLSLPGPPLRFFDAEGHETTGTHHTAPPVLDEHGGRVRAWLEETG